MVTDFAHDVKACALGQASSSIMARHVVGSTADELRELRETVRKMLKENGAPPEGKWADIALLEPVRDYKARHASTMLTFDAVVDAIGQIEAKAKQPAVGARLTSWEARIAACRVRGLLLGRAMRSRQIASALLLRAEPAWRTPPVGTRASAVLVGLAGCGSFRTDLAKAVLCRLRHRPARRCRIMRQHVGHRVGRHEIGELQFAGISSCKSSQGGTLSASDSRSPAPPMSKVYLASRPMSRSTIIRSCAL